MFRVLADGEERHRLEETDGSVVGWIHGRVIGFRGFDDEAHAIDAAAVAWRALDRVLRREFAGWPRHEPAYERLRVTLRGDDRWVTDGDWPLARLVPSEPAPGDDAPLALEFALPSYAQEGVAIAAAQLMSAALRGIVRPGPPTIGRALDEPWQRDARVASA